MVKKKLATVYTIIGVVLVLISVGIALNFGFLRDFLSAIRYQPSDEVAQIRDKLDLTERGWVIFGASTPELKNKQEFNQYCRDKENATAILGCYRSEKIYIYNILDEELDGIRELTAAHELLHAVYQRMSDKEKEEWNKKLEEIYNAHKDILGEEIELYDDAQKKEELYVRAGTEIKNLPEELEKHYAEIFRNQDKIVAYYDGYIAVFREIERRMNEILSQTESLKAEIDQKISQYETETTKLNTDINKFNNCAGTANCFSSNYVFNRQRTALIARQNELKSLYENINGLISEYNRLVEEYNENVLHGQTLNQAINSSVETEGI